MQESLIDVPGEPWRLNPGGVPELYAELRRLAGTRMAKESGPQTLSATALVHEAWLRLSPPQEDGEETWQSRRHFFGAAAVAMRRILIERARAKKRFRRGGNWERVEWREEETAGQGDEASDQLLAVNEALEALLAEDPVAGEIVNLRYFSGLKWQEIAELTGLTERALHRQWEYARAWLHTWITEHR